MSAESHLATGRGDAADRARGWTGHLLRRYAIFLILAGLILVFDFIEPAFLRVNNLFSVLQSVSVVALLGDDAGLKDLVVAPPSAK
jgi:hypothetical protein